MKIVICILFFTFSVSAQNSKSDFHKTVDSINAILKTNPLAYYTDNKQNSAFIKQISVSQQGIVSFTDSILKPKTTKTADNKKELKPDCCPPKTIRTLDLFAIEKWEILFPYIYLRDKKDQTYGRIIGIRKLDLVRLKKQFDNLTALSGKEETAPEVTVKTQETALTKQEAIDYIKSYYADFNTGSDQYSYDYGITKQGYEREYRKFTGNYKVEINHCKFKMTFDSYKWPYEEMKGTTVIEFDLSEIDSIKEGAREILETSDQPAEFVDINGAILLHFKKNKNATVLYKEGTEELLEKVDQVNVKIYEYSGGHAFTDNEIVKIFERLRELCNN